MNSESRSEILRLPVSVSLNEQRLDIGLVIAGVVSSRSQGQKLIDSKKILINGKFKKASYKLQTQDVIEVTIDKPIDFELLPYDFPLDIVFEDSQMIVVNKPSGLVVHPACGHESDTLINALVAYNKSLSEGSETFRPGLVHRLDKDTSGILVLAKNETSHTYLSKLFLERKIHRVYQAVVFGSFKNQQGTIESFLTRDPKNRKRFIAKEEPPGKKAITHYKVLNETQELTLLEIKLETGRTHQIRAHMMSLNHPIVGDDTYNGVKRARNLKKHTVENVNTKNGSFFVTRKRTWL